MELRTTFVDTVTNVFGEIESQEDYILYHNSLACCTIIFTEFWFNNIPVKYNKINNSGIFFVADIIYILVEGKDHFLFKLN